MYFIKRNRESYIRKSTYVKPDPYAWVNKEGYGTQSWAPSMLTCTQTLGLNDAGDDYLVTYIR